MVEYLHYISFCYQVIIKINDSHAFISYSWQYKDYTMREIFFVGILIANSFPSNGFSTTRGQESQFIKILSPNDVQSILHMDLTRIGNIRMELVCRWEMFLAGQVCYVDNSVNDYNDYLSCMEERFSDECHDAICGEMSDAGAPCPGDNRIATKRGRLFH